MRAGDGRVLHSQGPLAKEIMNTASKTLALDYVNEITSQADGYQRYLIAPEQGYREPIKLRVKGVSTSPTSWHALRSHFASRRHPF